MKLLPQFLLLNLKCRNRMVLMHEDNVEIDWCDKSNIDLTIVKYSSYDYDKRMKWSLVPGTHHVDIKPGITTKRTSRGVSHNCRAPLHTGLFELG